MTTPPAGVHLDKVLGVAAELRRICQRAVRVGVPASTFKQESWAAALAHVQDVSAGRQPNIHSDSALYRLLAHCPRPAWRWEHLEGLQDAHADDGEGERPAGRRIVTGPQRKHYHIETSLDGVRWAQDATADPSKTTARRARLRGPGRALPAIRVAPCFDGGCGWFTGTAPPTA